MRCCSCAASRAAVARAEFDARAFFSGTAFGSIHAVGALAVRASGPFCGATLVEMLARPNGGVMTSNDVVIEAWNTVLYDKFVRFKHLLVAGLAGHSDEALTRNQYPEGARVLDVGCGFGDSTIRIARSLGPRGAAFGVDCAEEFVRARGGARGSRSRCTQCTFFQCRCTERRSARPI